MEIIIYITSFIIGITFGSFFTLATYRIPLKQNITHKRSYCPICNHRLEFWDLIPVLSFVLLRGKCKYCKNKISPRYIFIEICSGLLFMFLAMSIKVNIYNIEIHKLIYLLYQIIFISISLIIGYIEKEKHYIENSVITFGAIFHILYIIYLYIFGEIIYKYVIYFALLILLIAINTISQKKNKNKNYCMGILSFCVFLLIGTSEEIMILTIITTLLSIAIKEICQIRKKEKNIPIGYYLSISNILILIINNFLRG